MVPVVGVVPAVRLRLRLLGVELQVSGQVLPPEQVQVLGQVLPPEQVSLRLGSYGGGGPEGTLAGSRLVLIQGPPSPG